MIYANNSQIWFPSLVLELLLLCFLLRMNFHLFFSSSSYFSFTEKNSLLNDDSQLPSIDLQSITSWPSFSHHPCCSLLDSSSSLPPSWLMAESASLGASLVDVILIEFRETGLGGGGDDEGEREGGDVHTSVSFSFSPAGEGEQER